MNGESHFFFSFRIYLSKVSTKTQTGLSHTVSGIFIEYYAWHSWFQKLLLEVKYETHVERLLCTELCKFGDGALKNSMMSVCLLPQQFLTQSAISKAYSWRLSRNFDEKNETRAKRKPNDSVKKWTSKI